MAKEKKVRHSRTVIVRQAQARVGIKEESAAHHEIVDRYNAHKPLAFGYMTKYEDPWCATFISYLAIIETARKTPADHGRPRDTSAS